MILVEMRRDYLGLREGEIAELGGGIAQLLIARGFAVEYERPAPEQPHKKKSPRRAVVGPEEKRVQSDSTIRAYDPARESR